jgi:hypothetical protein
MITKDLTRACTGQATTVILLADRNGDSQTTDHKNILIGLALKKYC